MGFLKGLRKFGGWNAKLGAIAAAPFTGGASLSLLPVANKIGGIDNSRAGGIVDSVGGLIGGGRGLVGGGGGSGGEGGGGGGSRASGVLGALSNIGGVLGVGAQGEAYARRFDAGLQADLADRNNQARLEAAKFNLEAPSRRTSQVARGDVLSSMQDAPRLGDARIDKFAGGGFRPSAFGASSRQAGGELQRQALMALMSGSDKITPELGSLPKSGKLEKLGGIGGLLGGLAGALQRPSDGVMAGGQSGLPSRSLSSYAQMPMAPRGQDLQAAMRPPPVPSRPITPMAGFGGELPPSKKRLLLDDEELL